MLQKYMCSKEKRDTNICAEFEEIPKICANVTFLIPYFVNMHIWISLK